MPTRKRLNPAAHATPGVRLIASFLLKVSLPSYLLFRTVEHCWPSIDSHLGWGCYTVLGSILVSFLHIIYTHIESVYHLYRARQLGAHPLPSVNGRWPGNYDLLKQWMGIWRRGYPGDIAGTIMKRLGDVETYHAKLFWKNTVFTADPEIVREMLTADHANYVKGRDLTNAMHSVLGSGVFNTNGDLWRFHRNMSRPFFTRERLANMIPVFVKHADKALDRLDRHLGQNQKEGGPKSIDVQDLASRFTLDSSTDFLFGGCVNSLNEPVQQSNGQPLPIEPKYRRSSQDSLLPVSNTDSTNTCMITAFPAAFTSALQTLATRLRSGSLWPLLEITKDSTKKDVTVIKGFVRSIVERALARRDRRDRKDFGPGQGMRSPNSSAVFDEKEDMEDDMDSRTETLLDHLVNVSDDIELIQDELINILIAGRDTTASCVTFAVYLLSQHPDILKQLVDEVHSVLGNGESEFKEPTLDNLREMPYLRAVINETLRLFPSVPLNVRDNIAERVWVGSDGTRWYLPAGTSITYSLLHIHRSPKLWGPTANQFDPSRFLQSDPRYQTYYARAPFVFMPFNAGPRSCLGQQLAYAEVGVFLCRLVQRLSGRSGGWRLDEEAIPEASRVPREWSNPTPSLPVGDVSDDKLPMHSSSSPILPATTPTGVSPRRAVEKVWPKSHLTMFVDGGLWMEFPRPQSHLQSDL